MKKNKLLLIGWDAADWKIIGPLLAKGQMPHLKKLIDNGVYGNMSTMNPPYSPMLWSTVATGKTPDKHGVLGFVEVVPNKKAIRPVTANSRNARAVWNILHNQGYKSNVVGWWPSFPAEPINGVIVSDKYKLVNPDPEKPSPITEGVIHPKEFVEPLKDLRMFPYDITAAHVLPFIPEAAKVDQTKKGNGVFALSKVLSESVSIHNASTFLLRNTEWDFMAIYHNFIDILCHSFMKFHPPKLPKVSEQNYNFFKDVIVGGYRFQDMMLGRVMELVDDDTTIIIMSDHGFESGSKRILSMPKVTAAPALEHRQFGMFVASGPNIKKKEQIFGLGLIDIAPTILHHFGLPVGRDMDGKVALDLFEKTEPPKMIDSWEIMPGDFGELVKEEVDAFSDEESLEQLIELGYIERPDEKIEIAILKTRCELKHNLARVYLGKKDYDNAIEVLLELIQEPEPIDTAPYYIDLVKAFLAQKKYEDAETYLNKFKTIKSPAKFNITYYEADILLGKNQPKKALKVLEESKAKSRDAELRYKIGNIHFILRDFEKARDAFEEAIEKEQDKAKYHKAMADTLYELGEYQESAEYALTSIELIKYFPAAHYALGRALEKLGDLENAKLAYQTAASLKPKTFHKAEKAIENIEEKLSAPEGFKDKYQPKHREGQIVVVSGLPRSGTSLMMQMLDKGGLDMLTDGERQADESNPKGYYEYKPVMSIHKDNSWLGKAQDKTVKIVAPLLQHLDRQYRYKVIFMKRNLDEVVKSQQKMIGRNPDVFPVKLYNAFVKQLEFVDNWMGREPGVEIIYVDYKDVLNNPEEISKKIEEFVGLPLQKEEMAKCVDKSLYRNRVEVKK